MQPLIEHLEGIIDSGRKKQIRVNGRQLIITPEIAESIVRVYDELSVANMETLRSKITAQQIDLWCKACSVKISEVWP